MVDRWTVERAVRHKECTLDPPGRHLVLTLLTWTDPHTAVIPERFTPSLTDLEEATGMARSSVAKWLNKVEEEGWVDRHRPTVADARRKKAKTTYRMQVPPELLRLLTELGVVGPRGGPVASESPRSAGPRRGPVKGAVGPPRGLTLVRQADEVGPPGELNPYRDQEPVGGRGDGDDHAYIEGPNGHCAVPGCKRSAPLHSRRINVVSRRERSVIGE
ncbi:MarR family winged helix-turn-helix transcriptional regulator [Micromonospora sp. CPCC 206060]|uniref:MarR family winged helix-turn-helix transcriptional regulator n=1 Tax=Micromonospora sp. CPCC 206060 TaxID=3122406 RepID=UPI002FEFEFC1